MLSNSSANASHENRPINRLFGLTRRLFPPPRFDTFRRVQDESLQGTLEKFIYNNEESHYTVAMLAPESGPRDQVTVVGNLVGVQCGEVLKLEGEWIVHPQFGRQFKIKRFESILPSTVTGLKKYLGSGLIKGIGKKYAEKIVDHFGLETLSVIDQFSSRLKEVPGIGRERASSIRAAWVEQKAVRDIMIFLQSYGITPGQASKIYKTYGEQAALVVKENPYRLARDIVGIGFKIADQIAKNLGIPNDSAHRVQAGVLYRLGELTSAGHTGYPHEALVEEAAQMLDVDQALAAREILNLSQQLEVAIEPQENLVYLASLHHCEKNLADLILRLVSGPCALPPILLDKAIEWVTEKSGFEMTPAQCEAVKKALTEKLMVITGGPGVGKTTIIQNVVRILAQKKAKILLCAPTGRAAKRLGESCSWPAKTIHRLLRYDPSTHSFTFNQKNPLEADLVVVDETSMLDVSLAYSLFSAIPPTASVVLVGDIDQLPSVGPGNVLRDIIDSKVAPVARLNEIFRQAAHSQIVANAHRLNEGVMPELSEAADGSSDFYFIHKENPEEVAQAILSLTVDKIPKKFGFDPVRDIQVLSPMHKGVVGVENLNRELQKALNPKRNNGFNGRDNELERFGRTFRVGDKVMQLVNDYDKGVFNGDLGIIQQIDRENNTVGIRFDDAEVEFEFTDMDDVVPAYATTIHKSQGSEYPCVIIPILTQHYVMLQRNLIYTAITRGRRLVVLIGTPKALAIAINNNKTAQRFGLLKQRLTTELV